MEKLFVFFLGNIGCFQMYRDTNFSFLNNIVGLLVLQLAFFSVLSFL